MIIVSSSACLMAFIIILWGIKQEIFNLRNKKISIHEEKIISVIQNKEEISQELLNAKETLKFINFQMENHPYTIKVLENIYKEKEINEKKHLEKKYTLQLEKNEKIIIKNTIKNMFDEDIKNVFSNYSCNIINLEKDLEAFFEGEK